MPASSLILPIAVCRDYNTPLRCDIAEECSRLHVCKYFVYGTCRKGDSCTRFHGVPSSIVQNNNIDLKQALENAKLPQGIPTPRGTVIARPLRWLGRTTVEFDLETTGLGGDSHIIQIAAVVGYQQFMRFVKPHKPINRQAQRITGFKFQDGRLFKDGNLLPAVSVFTALNHFINWLSQFDRPVLVAHNAKHFDARILVSSLKATKMFDKFKDVTVGFLDSLSLTKEVLPHLRKYSLENVYKYYFHKSYPAHDALNDCRALNVVLNEMQPAYETMLRHTFDVVYINWANRSVRLKKICEDSLLPIVKAGQMSKPMAQRAAASGLDYNSLKFAHKSGILKDTLSYNIDGRVRVSANLEVVKKVENYFVQHTSDE